MQELKPIVPTEDIIALHEEGLPPSEIATRLGTTYDIIYKRLVRAGLEPHVRPPPPPVSIEDIITLHKEGLSPYEIADRLGIHASTVERRLVAAGYTPHFRPRVSTEDIIALHEEGLPPSEIAARLNITSEVVRSRLYRAGLIPHPEPKAPPKPPPVVEQKDIEDLHKEGLSPSEIAARLNVSPQFITWRLVRAGFKPHPHPVWGEAKERTREIVSLHNEGYTPKQIAEKLGLVWRTVHKHLREARIAPHPSAAEAEKTLRGLDEIVSLAKEGIPRQEIAKRISTTWPLVAEALEKTSVKPVWPACEELRTWASSLLPILEEIKKAHPDTEPILRKVDELEKELVAIKDATWTVEQRLPYRGKEADEERWCVAPISYAASEGLDRIDALKGCVKQLDVVTEALEAKKLLPGAEVKPLKQAETCISDVTNVIGGAIIQAKAIAEEAGVKASELVVGIGDSVCDKYSGTCGRIVDILNDEVLIEPTIRKKADMEYFETTEPPIRAKKINLEPDHIRRGLGAELSEQMLHQSPISPHCERVLGEPPKCYDFRGIRSYVMCKAWDLMEKEKRARLPVGEAWAEARKVCVFDDARERIGRVR